MARERRHCNLSVTVGETTLIFMNKLTWHDLQFALLRCPKTLLNLMKEPKYKDQIFVGGGFLRSIVSGDEINDIDIFTVSKDLAVELSLELTARKLHGPPTNPTYQGRQHEITTKDLDKLSEHIHTTENALTLTAFNPPLQIIHRWNFGSVGSVAESFDFTCCCAAFSYNGIEWESYCDDRFYPDVAARRLIYRFPVRDEEPGGSMLRILKYYKKGYRVPLDSLGGVIARLMNKVSFDAVHNEGQLADVITGLLREVDPAIDASHVAHLPAEAKLETPTNKAD